MKTDTLRKEVVALLTRAQAHAMPDTVFANVPHRLRHARPPGGSHSVWEVLEHMRLAQEDILRYALEKDWRSPAWPEGYWPDPAVTPDATAWAGALAAFQADLKAAVRLARNPKIDLTRPIPHAKKHTYLRELLLIADHNAYHAGQVVEIRRALGDWR
jgi:uncharacterized damage-inducible protein DinB